MITHNTVHTRSHIGIHPACKSKDQPYRLSHFHHHSLPDRRHFHHLQTLRNLEPSCSKINLQETLESNSFLHHQTCFGSSNIHQRRNKSKETVRPIPTPRCDAFC